MATFSKSKTNRSSSPLRSSAPATSSRRQGSHGNLRKSTGRGLAASFDLGSGTQRPTTRPSTTDIMQIENEYIRNLQQQIYFLELEAEYLRDQARKSSLIPPRVTEEADKMMRRLKELQRESDDRMAEVSRKEASVRSLEAEKETAVRRLRDAEEAHAMEKRQLVSEVVSLKKQLSEQERGNTRREMHVQQIRNEADRGITALTDAENKIQVLKEQVDNKAEQVNLLRVELEEKRAECLRTQTQLQELEERYFDSQAKTKDQIGHELKEEIRTLRLQLREKEINAEQDRSLRNKIQDDCTALIRENAALSAQVIELQKMLDLERAHKDEKQTRRHANIQELVTSKENEKRLELELEKVKDLLRVEEHKYQEAMQKLTKEEQIAREANVKRTHLRGELNELEVVHNTQGEENVTLRRDKIMLTDHITELNSKLDERDDEIERLKIQLEEAEAQVSQLNSKVRLQRNLESVKWEEFEKLANTMREFSQQMSPQSTRSRHIEYD